MSVIDSWRFSNKYDVNAINDMSQHIKWTLRSDIVSPFDNWEIIKELIQMMIDFVPEIAIKFKGINEFSKVNDIFCQYIEAILFEACRAWNLEFIKKILPHISNINWYVNARTMLSTLIEFYQWKKHFDIVDLLVNIKGINLNVKDLDVDNNAVLKSCHNHCFYVLELFFTHPNTKDNISLIAEDKYWNSPLMLLLESFYSSYKEPTFISTIIWKLMGRKEDIRPQKFCQIVELMVNSSNKIDYQKRNRMRQDVGSMIRSFKTKNERINKAYDLINDKIKQSLA